MNTEIFGCKNCGAPNRIINCQLVTRCVFCDRKYYINREIPPAVVLKTEIEIDKAMELISNELEKKEISRGFFENAVFKSATLYYIPFFEVRRVEGGRLYQSYGYLEKANDLKDLEIEFLKHLDVENSILKSLQVPFDPVKMRKNGVIIPPDKIQLLKKKDLAVSFDVVENYHRVIYFPVWEINYSYQGIVFKNYLSAVDGEIIVLRALRDHRKKTILSLLGLLSLAVFLGRAPKEGAVFALFTVAFGIPLLTILLPYFWELFAFREIIEVKGGIARYFPIYYTEKSFKKMSRMLFKRFVRIFGSKSKDD